MSSGARFFSQFKGGALGLLTAAALGSVIAAQTPAGNRPDAPAIRTLSTHHDRVSGGNVLVEIVVPSARGSMPVNAALNGRDVSSVFRPVEAPGTYTGLVTGLALGRNTLHVAGAPFNAPDATLELTNYPLTGPIVSGPHVKPFVCQTEEFKLPDGSTIGAPLDADCAVATRVQYVYMPAGGDTFKPVPSTTPSSLPADVAMTTTTAGKRVPFVVRVETGSMNRGIYQNVVLHDPTRDRAPTPFTPPPGWNRRLIALHGVGCPTGWYRQGGVMGVDPLKGVNVTRLGEGYALFINTLNHPTNSCNALLAGETTMMGKEHFIETFGVPDFTISMGTSGGAYTSLQVADTFPGLIDGLVITQTFPDALSIALAGLDARLLMHYFTVTNPGGFTEAQQVALGGYHGMKAMIDAANQAQRTDPVPDRKEIEGYESARWHASVPAALRYHPGSNRQGARPTVFDIARNVYGTDPATGFALRPYDNVGVQYGLAALKSGAITMAQFLDLNERIGGYDQDSGYTPARAEGDAGAIKRAYQSGLTLGGGGGLASIPVFDAGGYREDQRYHYAWFHFAARERMRNENGRADNHLMWRGPAVPAEKSWDLITRWVAAIKADTSHAGAPDSAWDRMMRNRPADAVDGCWTAAKDAAPAEFIAEPQTFSREPTSRCNTLYPSYSFTRQVAGGPLDANVLKCQLKPIDPADYGVALSPTDRQRLERIFPGGVCDWSKSGVDQTRVVSWPSFGPAPDSLALRPLKPSTAQP
ncbi:MAG TPA: DUF6351 family protein [Vicinamibacterales bacterium]|nr:DUF6351 family protein [Vicinamibacterales bacterium]